MEEINTQHHNLLIHKGVVILHNWMQVQVMQNFSLKEWRLQRPTIWESGIQRAWRGLYCEIC